MPHLDRFLTALVSNNATALLLAADDVAHLEIGDAARPVTKQPLNAAQLVALVREQEGGTRARAVRPRPRREPGLVERRPRLRPARARRARRFTWETIAPPASGASRWTTCSSSWSRAARRTCTCA